MQTKMTIRKFSAAVHNEGERLDKFLVEICPDITRSAIVLLIAGENVSVNGKLQPKNYRIKSGDFIEVRIPEPESTELEAEEIPLDIVYEDEFLLVVNKPRGMVVHPAAGHKSGTLVNALMHHCGDSLSGINGEIRPGIVHRIDKDTSGLLMVAKTDKAHVGLAEQIKNHSFTRLYQAVVIGSVKDGGTVDAPIGRDKNDRKKMCVTDRNSRNATTHFEVVKNFGEYTHLRLRLETGRTHQIRVHMAYIGHPLAGDFVYGNGRPKWLNGQCLHASELGFVHPISGEEMRFSSELPDYFVKFLKNIDK